MKNLSISLLNVKDISKYLKRLKEIEQDLENTKIKKHFDISIHFDVMDNKFVPNTGIDISKIDEVNKFNYYIDTHLMVENPIYDKYIEDTINMECLDITIHYEINNFEKVLDYLYERKKSLNGNLKIGVALKPKTDISVIEKYIKKIDKVLVMSVEPGFGGQKFMQSQIEKIIKLKEKYKDITIQVDGGINSDTIAQVIRAGADSFVVGSYLTKNEDELKDKIDILNIILDIETTPKEADLDFERRTIQAVDGGYAQGDILLGIRVLRLRKLAKLWYNIVSLNTLKYFISSNIHDYRRFAIFCLVNKINANNKDEIKKFIDENIQYINNWDLVDSVAPICIGKQLILNDDEYIYNVLRKYTISDNVWQKRMGIVSLLYLAKLNRKECIFKVLDDVFFEEYHLYQKATGWVLRELYKVNPKDTLMYLVTKSKMGKIPSILKSYATEKMSIKEKSLLK